MSRLFSHYSTVMEPTHVSVHYCRMQAIILLLVKLLEPLHLIYLQPLAKLSPICCQSC